MGYNQDNLNKGDEKAGIFSMVVFSESARRGLRAAQDKENSLSLWSCSFEPFLRGREKRSCAALRRIMRHRKIYVNAGGTAEIFALRVFQRAGCFLLHCQKINEQNSEERYERKIRSFAC